MGSNSTKESQPDPSRALRPTSSRHTSSQIAHSGRAVSSRTEWVGDPIYASRSGRGSRPDLSFLGLGGGVSLERETVVSESRRETKQEREARKLEKERVARQNERERSMREEGVDGGYVVTLGTYTGVEDYNKALVRQLMIERRLAPFWKGLNDYSNSWTEHQLVAAARGLAIPAPDEITLDMARTTSQASSNPRASDTNLHHLAIPISSRSQSYHSDTSATLSASHPAFSNSGPASPSLPTSPTSPLFRGRAKTLATLTTSAKSASSDLTPQEIHLPKDGYINGQSIEAYLYKDAMECPICFLYYPPYLNKTRCCDQPICSECFVQIRRPDPHPPEHHDDPNNIEPRPPQEDGMLVSEPSACPFCVTPEFGVTYDPPPFRRGLAYTNQGPLNPFAVSSAMSSSSSLTSMSAPRRRTVSLSANAPAVITTDRVRPDWAKKLSDARAHALRRSAAATALHNAAYVLGNQGGESSRFGLGRRRRTLFTESPSASGSGTPRFPEGLTLGNVGALIAHVERHGDGELYPARNSSRRNRVEDLEELMMLEAIRLSLAAEDDRKRKEDKENAKQEKKEAKVKAKEDKKRAKEARKGGFYPTGGNESVTSWTSMARSSSNLGIPPQQQHESQVQGKGKGVDRAGLIGFNPLSEPTSTLNTEMASSGPSATVEGAQRHLEESRANLHPALPIPASTEPHHRLHLRQLSSASSSASSFIESMP
ncbi:SNF1-interacting protein, partial [Elasticomyces elasticus]